MRKPGSLAPSMAIAVVVCVSLSVVDGADLPKGGVQIGLPPILPRQTAGPDPGPMPPLDPIGQFVPPIDPWEPGGFGWDEPGLDDEGEPLCQTNRRPTPRCDPEGPRPFLHAGFDAAPAPDRVVRASAVGRVVVARPTTAFVTGRSECEGAGIVVLEHDRDGDPATTDDRVLTIYGHVEPEVQPGQIVAGGERIALTSTERGDHLHFAVRQGPFDPASLDLFRAFLPPRDTFGCAGCYSRFLREPAFPDLWQDPEQLFTTPPAPFWLAIFSERQESASDVLETEDGSEVYGYSLAPEGRGMAVRRLDREGNVVSQDAYYVSGFDAIKRVERTPDGGVIALALFLSSSGRQVPMLVKFDPAGEVQWARQYGVQVPTGFPPGRLWWEDIAVTTDGGYVVTGTSQPFTSQTASIAVVRLDAAGVVQWFRNYDPTFVQGGADGMGIAPASDGGFVILANYQTSNPAGIITRELMAFRIDTAGTVLWATVLGNGLNNANPGGIKALSGGGFVVTALRTVASYFLPSMIWVVRLNEDGTTAWSSLYGSTSAPANLEEGGTALVATTDGGVVVAGYRGDLYTNPSQPDVDLIVMRLDGAGGIVSQRRLDSLGMRTWPLGLRATDDGFLLAAGTRECRLCPFLGAQSPRFLAAHLDGRLDCPGGCAHPYDLARLQERPAGVPTTLRSGVVSWTSADTQVTRGELTGLRYLCNNGAFGAPPALDPASIEVVRRTASCDRTDYAEAYVCAIAGPPGVQATSPVILGIDYDSLLLTARVVDGDSTPEQSDIVSVTATISSTQIPLLDDGSLTILTGFHDTVTVCREDPVAGVCSCGFLGAPYYSGDTVGGDGTFTLETSITLPFTGAYAPGDVGKGCVHENRPLSSLLNFFPGAPLSVTVRATDRLGNAATTTKTVTPTAAAMSCTGDALLCCLLTHPDTADCVGLAGMTSPQTADGAGGN